MLSFDQKFQIEGLPATPNLESAINQSIKRAEKIMPVEVIQIKENPDMKHESRRCCSASASYFEDDGGFGRAYRLDSNFEVNEKAVKLKLKLDGTPHIAGYEPSVDTYLIGRGAIDHLENNREIFFYDVNHEAAHDEYLNLGLDEQRALNDLFIQDKTLNEFLRKFATVLYTDKSVSKDKSGRLVGDKYLKAHDMAGSAVATHISSDDQRGIKDKRSMEILINDQKKDVLFGALVTEFSSFMAACERGKEAFNKVVASYQKERNGEDLRFDVISLAYDYLKNNSELKKEFDKAGLFKNNNSEFLERFAKETSMIWRHMF
ncbi:MAG: hypothetical protein ACD_7C00525G0001 [uncultured bacterium]|nr:MAG: hypothetical protein ACD_7C00525G0001 [uncultured bacterium]HBR79101.1 hypothetical protein [Candidatus Moranbacteria bacterium]